MPPYQWPEYQRDFYVSYIEIGADAVLTTGDTAALLDDRGEIVNYGRVYVGGDGHGLKTKSNSTVYNFGEIYTQGGEGLKLDSTNTTAYNYGTINAGDEGVEGRANFHFENYGTVSAVDDAVQADANMYVLNYGVLESTGVNVDPSDDLAGDGVDIDYGIVDNYGIIRATDQGEAGIDFDKVTDVTKTTTIYNHRGALIQGGYGIFLDVEDRAGDLSPKTIYNWGTIIGTNGMAVQLGASDDTLVVHNGSRISGLIDLGESAEYDSSLGRWVLTPNDSDNDTFDYEASGPAVFVFANALPETIISPTTSYATSGMTVIFGPEKETAASDRATADMVQALGSVLATHMGGIVGTPEDRDAKGRPGWATVFGSRKDQDENDDISGYEHSFGGLVGGFDGELTDNVRGGLFFGSTLGKLDIDASEKNEIDSTHVFGGAYATTEMNGIGRLEVSLLGGVGFNDKSRTMMVNTTGSGDAELEADYTTAFVSPEAALSLRLAQTADSVFIARPSVRYVGLFTEEIEETGDGVSWSTGSRSTHILEGRFTLSAMTTFADTNGMLTRIGATAGVIGYTTSGDDIDVAFSAATYSGGASFAGTDPSQVGAIGGVSLSTELSKSSILFGEVEGTVFDEDAYAVSGKAGLRMNY